MTGTQYSCRKSKRFARAICEAKLQLRAASRRLAVVKNVSVQCVHEFVALAHRSVLHTARAAHHELPARQALANAFEHLGTYRGAERIEAGRERSAAEARDL